jgi:hypothetical protein
MDLQSFKYIIWVDQGFDGWIPTGCNTNTEILAAISTSYGRDWILTKPVEPPQVIAT